MEDLGAKGVSSERAPLPCQAHAWGAGPACGLCLSQAMSVLWAQASAGRPVCCCLRVVLCSVQPELAAFCCEPLEA